MQAHWGALAVGAVIGAVLGWWMASNTGGTSGGRAITGTINAPFQRKISRS